MPQSFGFRQLKATNLPLVSLKLTSQTRFTSSAWIDQSAPSTHRLIQYSFFNEDIKFLSQCERNDQRSASQKSRYVLQLLG